jgi:hypothetical protein
MRKTVITQPDHVENPNPSAQGAATDKRLFVSYSHKDTKLVGSVVSLLRATKGSPVFRDHDTIVPGTMWRAEIERGLGAAETVVVFWCRHAEASMEVRNEWLAAITAKKQVLPLLLDSTPLPEELAKFQWIDFQEYGARAHRKLWQNPVAIGLATFGFVGVIALSALLTLESPGPLEGSGEPPAISSAAERALPSPQPLPPGPIAASPPAEPSPDVPKPAAPAPPPANQSLVPWVLSWVGIAAVVAFLIRKRRRPSKEKLFDERAKWPVRPIHQEMANAIVAELSKR